MNIFGNLKSIFTKRGRALSFYRNGMTKAKLRDYDAAIADYTSAVNLAGTPPDVVAMALFNRGLVYVACEKIELGKNDFKQVLTMKGAGTKTKTMAQQKLVRMQKKNDKLDGKVEF